MINAACTRCIQERWPVKPGDEVPAAIAVLNGEGMCMGHMAPPPIDPGDPVIERLARHLRKNYRPGTTDVPWADADDEERDVWCTEAAHFLEVAQLEILGWSVPVSVNHPTVALLPVEETVLPGPFVEDEPPLMVVEGTTKLPPKWSQPRSD
jgi:hypothetical protein